MKRAADVVAAEMKHRAGKDTRRWCRGVVGREHEWTFDEWKHSRSARYEAPVTMELCKHCRKEKGIVRDRRWWYRSAQTLGPAY